jgi:hypothetical protein
VQQSLYLLFAPMIIENELILEQEVAQSNVLGTILKAHISINRQNQT